MRRAFELEAEKRKAARDAETRRIELVAEQRRAQMQLQQAKLDHEIRMLEMSSRPTQLGEGEGDDGQSRPSLEGRVIWRFRQSDFGK